jgi:hypothetical protein
MRYTFSIVAWLAATAFGVYWMTEGLPEKRQAAKKAVEAAEVWERDPKSGFLIQKNPAPRPQEPRGGERAVQDATPVMFLVGLAITVTLLELWIEQGRRRR